MRRLGLAIAIILLSVCILLMLSLFSLQMGNEALARQLLHYAEGSLILGATVIAYVIMRQLIQRAQGHIGKYKDESLGFDYEEV